MNAISKVAKTAHYIANSTKLDVITVFLVGIVEYAGVVQEDRMGSSHTFAFAKNGVVMLGASYQNRRSVNRIMKIFGLGKKQVAARLCSAVKLDTALIGLEGLYQSPIRIINFHRVLDAHQLIDYPFNEDMVEVTSEELESRLSYLSNNFDVIGFDNIIDFVDDKAVLPKKPVLITFDDGYSDNYEVAFPIIKSVDIPVTMMLATGYIGGEETFWTDWLAFIIFNIDIEVLVLDELRFILPANREGRRTTFYRIINHFKSVSDEKRLQLLDNMKQLYGSLYDELPDDIKALSRPMNWQQINEMSQAGIQFGSHTVNHPFLSKVSRQQLEVELADSKQVIEKNTGKTVSVLAYPNGQEEDFNDEVKRVAQSLGYKLGLSYINGVNDINNFDRYSMKRMHISPSHDSSTFKMALAFPIVFSK